MDFAIILIVTGAKCLLLWPWDLLCAGDGSGAGNREEYETGRNESVEEVGKILKKAGLIRDARTFTIQAKCYGYEVKAGTYELNTSKDSKKS